MISPSDAVIIGVVLVFLAAIGLRFWLRRPRPAPVRVPIYEEGPTRVEVKSWSPTRGHYWFDSSSFPTAYRALPQSANGLVRVQGENEADALAELNRWLGDAVLKMSKRKPEPITSSPVRFRAFTRRKGQA